MEVKASESIAKRSLTTGHLLITMPKFDPNEKAFLISSREKKQKNKKREKNIKSPTTTLLNENLSCHQNNNSKQLKYGLQEELLQEATQSLTGPVQYQNIVKEKNHEVDTPTLDMIESSTRWTKQGGGYNNNDGINCDDDEPPEMF